MKKLHISGPVRSQQQHPRREGTIRPLPPKLGAKTLPSSSSSGLVARGPRSVQQVSNVAKPVQNQSQRRTLLIEDDMFKKKR